MPAAEKEQYFGARQGKNLERPASVVVNRLFLRSCVTFIIFRQLSVKKTQYLRDFRSHNYQYLRTNKSYTQAQT